MSRFLKGNLISKEVLLCGGLGRKFWQKGKKYAPKHDIKNERIGTIFIRCRNIDAQSWHGFRVSGRKWLNYGQNHTFSSNIIYITFPIP